MKIILLFLTFLSTMASFGQQLVSSSGGSLQNSQQSMSFSIGETIVDCFSVGSVLLSQGMQQANPGTITMSPSLLEESTIQVYPNPTSSGRCLLDLAKHPFGDLSYRLVDASGVLIQTQKILRTTTALSLVELSAAVYYLQIIDHQNRFVKTVKIIKQ